MTILPLILLAVSPFQIDGTFTDWDKGITRAEDEFYSYQRITLPTEQCLQQLPSQLNINMDGYDITFSPTAFGHGVSCKRNGQKISPYSIGLVFSPTTASTMFEIRINKRVTVLPTTTFDLTPLGDLRVVSWKHAR